MNRPDQRSGIEIRGLEVARQALAPFADGIHHGRERGSGVRQSVS